MNATMNEIAPPRQLSRYVRVMGRAMRMNKDLIYKIVRDEVSEICNVSSAQFENSTDLFALGFHSLLVVQLVSRLRNTFNTPLELKDFFISPCVDGIVDMIDSKLAESYE